jgi:hypothetical protein
VTEHHATVTVPSLSSGPGVSNFAVTLPAGTAVTASDGTTSVLAADTVVYVQRVALSDPADPDEAAGVRRGRLLVDADDDPLIVLLKRQTELLELIFDCLKL